MGTGFIVYGHYYRYPLDSQFQAYAGAGNVDDVPKGYPFLRSPADTFSFELYQKIRSLKDAVEAIKKSNPGADEEQLAKAVFELVRKRFVHFMYPRHTYLTNPFLALFRSLVPHWTFDAMYLGDDLLRHTAGASCGQAAGVFIEIWRKLGGQARACNLLGHDIAEAKINGRLWVVDPDLEAMGPYSVEEIRSNPDLVSKIYTHLQDSTDLKGLKEAFAHPGVRFFGFDGPPTTSPRIYKGQKLVNVLKFVFFPAIAFISYVIFYRLVKRRRNSL
jgi:hypothetical protein